MGLSFWIPGTYESEVKERPGKEVFFSLKRELFQKPKKWILNPLRPTQLVNI